MEGSEQREQGLQLPPFFSTDVRTIPVSDSPMGWGFVTFAPKGYRGLNIFIKEPQLKVIMIWECIITFSNISYIFKFLHRG